MSWVCEYCSSANEGCQRDCFVCGNPRSAASVRAGKREARKRRAASAGRRLWRGANIGGRVAFYASIAMFTVMAAVMIITKVNHHEMGGVADNLAALAAHLGANLKGLFGGRADGGSIALAFGELFTGRSSKYAEIGDCFAGAGDRAGATLRSLGQTASLLLRQIAEQVDVTVDNFGRMVRSIRYKF